LKYNGYISALRANCQPRATKAEFQGSDFTLKEWLPHEHNIDEVYQYRKAALNKLVVYAQQPQHTQKVLDMLCEHIFDIAVNGLIDELCPLLAFMPREQLIQWSTACLAHLKKEDSNYPILQNLFIFYLSKEDVSHQSTKQIKLTPLLMSGWPPSDTPIPSAGSKRTANKEDERDSKRARIGEDASFHDFKK
jgi:hypothetical protein